MVSLSSRLGPTNPSRQSFSDEWRRHGETLRQKLLQEDDESGASLYDVNGDCPIERYYGVSNRVGFIFQ
jgi:hypothetical protein